MKSKNVRSKTGQESGTQYIVKGTKSPSTLIKI